MSYVKKIDDYLIKDEEARNQIAQLTPEVIEATETANNANTNATTARQVANQNRTLISGLDGRIRTLESYTHMNIVYDAENETIKFE